MLKKAGLDVEELKNFRPVSNLPFMGKIIERAAVSQFQAYMRENDLYTKNQSAYRRFHSVETALVKVNNDLLKAVDEHGEAVLVLLDMSAAFDTVDHNVMLRRLQDRYGVNGTAHRWFASYLCNRQQSVLIDCEQSDPTTISFGVPQGSVVGPEMFIAYSAPIEDIINAHNLCSMSYADDTQIYVLIKPPDRVSKMSKLEECICDIQTWLTENKLMLNASKTELLHVKSCYARAEPRDVTLTIGTTTISPSLVVRDLGVVFDKHLKMVNHVNGICRRASYAIYKIGKLRRYLDSGNTQKLVHAFISSRLDNCNSILAGLPCKELSKLQRVQNMAARVVTLSRKSTHITPVMQELHWLPIRQRIVYKILLLTYKILVGEAPAYLSDLVSRYNPKRTLRSSSRALLSEKPCKTTTYGRSFSNVAPKLWNALPDNLRMSRTLTNFKSGLKTHLFKIAYDV